MTSDSSSPSYFGKVHKYTGLSWPGWSTVLIHGTGFVFLTAMTLYDFVPLLTDYRDRNVAIEINIIVPGKNDTIPRPSTSVCIPYYSGAIPNLAHWLATMGDQEADVFLVEPGATMEREAMTNHSWDVWNRWNTTTTSLTEDGGERSSAMSDNEFRVKLIVDLIKKLIDERDFDEPLEFRPINLNWNQAIVDALWQFLGCITDMDTIYITGDRPLVTTCMDIAALSDLDGVRDLFELFYDKVINATIVYFDIAYRMSAEPDTPIIRPPDLIRQRPVYLFDDYFCFEVAAEVADESYAYSPWPIPNDTYPFPWQRFHRSREYYVTPSRSVLFASLGSASNLYKTSSDHLSNPEINEEEIRLTYQIESTVREKRPEKMKTCSWDPVPQACVVRRQIERAIEYCGCRPFTFRFLTSSPSSSSMPISSSNTYDSNNRTIPYCTKRIYESCNRSLQSNLDRIQEECNDRCEYVTFKWQKSEVIRHNPMRRGLGFYVEMTASKEVYKEFSQIIRDPPEKFASQIGGIVNLYLGVSGLSLCAFMTFCIRSYDRYKRLNAEKTGRDSIDGGIGGNNDRNQTHGSGDSSMNLTRRRSINRSDSGGDDDQQQVGFGFGWTRGGSFHHGGSGHGHHTVKGGQMAKMQRQLDAVLDEMKMIKEKLGRLETGMKY